MNTPEQRQYYNQFPLPEAPLAAAPVAPDNPPWNSWMAFAVFATSVLLIVFLPAIFLAPYLFSKMGPGFGQSQVAEIATKDPTAILIQMAAILPVHLITLLVGYFVVTKFRKYPFFETLGWRSGGMRWWHYVLILAGFFGLAALVGYFVPEQENELIRILQSSKMALYTVAFLAVVTAPLVEEVVYRGVMYSAFQRTIGKWAAIGLVTFCFAVIHVPQYYPSFSTIFLLTLLSLILTLIRAQTGNLLPCVIMHTVFNGLQSALLLAQSVVDVPAEIPVDPSTVGLFFK